MIYHIHSLKENLVLITWFKRPNIRSTVDQLFIEEIRHLLDEATQPLYFLSDLRRGFIRNPLTLRNLAKTFNHPNFAGAASFSDDIVVEIAFNIYLVSSRRYRYTRHREAPYLYTKPEGALAFLEQQAPGLSSDIDWYAVLNAQA